MRSTASMAFMFVATCPKCKDVRSQAAQGYRVLIQLLTDDGPIHANCKICGESWTLSDLERTRLERDLMIFRFL